MSFFSFFFGPDRHIIHKHPRRPLFGFSRIHRSYCNVRHFFPWSMKCSKYPFFSSIRLTGNGILRAAHFAHYTNNASAALIGVVGSLISVFILGLFRPCIPKTRDEKGNEKIHWSIQACMCLLLSTLSGTIGSAVLLRGHVDLGGIDILHATRAGALGGAILGPGSVLIAPWVLATIFFVFSPVWLAISMGARWVGERSSGDWTERNRSYSYCYCCGTRDDPA